LHIIDRLSQIPIPSYVDVVDCGCDLLSLASYANKPQKIIIIDAIRAGGRPGRVYRFDYAELRATRSQMRSAHQLKTLETLELLKHVCPDLDNCEITFIGVEPKMVELNSDLSKEVSQSLADVTMLVLEEIALKSSWQQNKELT
jgi:hydrogenase maturation protease